MLTERNNRTHQQQQQYVSSSSSTSSSFTANQWQELENQVLTFRYLMSGVPVPPALMSSVITSSSSISTTSSSSSMFPLHQQLPLGLSCFQVGYGYGYGRKVDPEPGRCKRTDGKKWRCSKEAHPDSKYCERHMNRGKGKSKKQQQSDALSNSKAVTSSNTYPNPNPTVKTSCLPYPAVISYCAETQPTYPNKFQAASSNSNSNSNNNNNSTSTLYPFLPAQSLANHRASSDRDDVTSTPHWLGLDGVADLHDHHPIPKDLRYSNQMKGGRVEESRMMGSEGSSQEQQEEKLAVDQQEHDSQKLYHHFLGDWPMKSKTSYDIGLFSRSN